MAKEKLKILRRAFKYRAYPNKGTYKRAIRAMVEYAVNIWNPALEERQTTYHQSLEDDSIKPVNSYRAQYGLVRKKEHPEFSLFNAESMQDVLIKLDSSFKSFFALIKKDPTARPPRSKGIHRCLTYRQKSGWTLIGNILYIRNIGKFRLRLHRPIIGEIKTVSITKPAGGPQWYVSFSCDLGPEQPKTAGTKTTTLSVEPNIFVKDSTGRIIEHPRFYFTEIEKLRRLARSLSRKQKGSKNRKKAKYTLNKWHKKMAAKRKYFLWKIANYYIANFDIISIPKLPIKNILQQTTSAKAQRLCDAAYSLFFDMLRQKARENGKIIEEYVLSNEKIYESVYGSVA